MERGENSKKASKIFNDNKKEYQRLLKAEITAQKGKKDVCKAAKAASKKHKKMTWKEALQKVSAVKTKSSAKQTTDFSQLKFEAKKGFRWKKNAKYVLRYEDRIAKAYHVFEMDNPHAKLGEVMEVKCDNPNIGVELIKYMRKKFAYTGHATINYKNITYPFTK